MPDDPCTALRQRLDDIVAEIHAVQASMPKPPLPPSELHRYETRLWELNRERINAVAALDRCLNPPPLRPTLYVDGNVLRDRTGTAVTLRGVNYSPLYNESFPAADYLDEIVKTGANAIRIVWFVEFGTTVPPAELDGLLTRCRAAGMIPIVELADLTGRPDVDALNATLIPWWTSAEVVGILNKHADCLIINLANELGLYHFSDDGEAAATTAFVNAYTKALQSIRAAGLAMPVMIDAPDYGTSLDFFVNVGAELVAADPGGNVLLSAHAYWAGNDRSAQIATCIDLGLPIVFGEIANLQDQVDDQGKLIGYYNIDGGTDNPAPSGFNYQALLTLLGNDAVGWLAWGWDRDICTARQLSEDGTYNALTPYGQDIVTNPTYGLNFAVKATIAP